jgi:hypothetical protein
MTCYYEIDQTATSTDSNGNTVVTTSTSYYFCEESKYWDEVLVETYYGSNLCTSIPSGYSYDSKGDTWYYSSSSTSADSSTGVTTTTTIIWTYDCSTNVYSIDTVYTYDIDYCNTY